MIFIALTLIGCLVPVILIVLLWLLTFFFALNVPGIWKMFLCWRFDSMSDFLLSHPLVCLLLCCVCLFLFIRFFILFEKSFCSWLDSDPFDPGS